MSVLLKSGRISHIGKATMTSGSHQNGSHSWSLRIDNMPATIKSQSHLRFADGDFVTAAGDMKNGTLNIYSYRNETTGAHQNPGSSAGHVLGVFFNHNGHLAHHRLHRYTGLADRYHNIQR